MPAPTQVTFDRLRALAAIDNPDARESRDVLEAFTGTPVTTIPVGTEKDVEIAFTRARAAQQESVDIVHVIINHGGGIRGGKASMKLVGIDCGDCRLPLAPYTEAEIARLDEELRAIGFKKQPAYRADNQHAQLSGRFRSGGRSFRPVRNGIK